MAGGVRQVEEQRLRHVVQVDLADGLSCEQIVGKLRTILPECGGVVAPQVNIATMHLSPVVLIAMEKILIAALLLSTTLAPAASYLPQHLRTDGKGVQKAFASAAEAAQKCTVRVKHGSKMVLGTLVSKDGLIICKDSEFSTTRPGRIDVVFANVRSYFRAKVVARFTWPIPNRC